MIVNDWLVNLIEELEKVKPQVGTPNLKIAVISTPRCGSGYFCDTLADTGVFGNPDEWFHPNLFEIFASKQKNKSINFTQYLNYIISRTTSDNMVFTVNFHIDHYIYWRKKGIDLLTIGFDRVIYLHRKDKLSQAYSLAKAMASSQWNSEMTPTHIIKTSDITNPKILHALYSISLWDEFYNTHMKQHVNSIYEYEEFVGNHALFESILDECNISTTVVKNRKASIKIQRNKEDFERLQSLKDYLNLKHT